MRGFTLIELAIVLVIIGLIVGGVLVGSELIRIAGLRATVTQYENYKAAYFVFKNRYIAVPGDMSATMAAQYGFLARSGNVGRGDGNGLIETSSDPSANTTATNYAGEPHGFWKDLSDAQLIEFSPRTASVTSSYAAGDGSGFITCPTSRVFPVTKIDSGIHWVMVYDNRAHHLLISQVLCSNMHNNALSPSTAYYIDTKLDDGMPQTGIARAITHITQLDGYATPAAPAAGVCVSNAATDPYNMGYEEPACKIMIKLF